jgi:MFS transporter, FSR family, fosmidomycin resistance protein
MATVERTARQDATVIGLIGVAHGCSHFYQLVLPPLFPFIMAEFDVGYTEVGVLITVYFIVSGLLQPPAGFVVDRIGATRVLLAGILMAAGGVLLYGLTPSFWALLPLVAIAGVGNAVFHPTDYTILTASVSERRLGRAYGVHTVGGNLGWAVAWAIMWPLANAIGWRGALIATGCVGLVVAAALFAYRHHFRDHRGHAVDAGERPGARPPAPSSAAMLLALPVLLCLLYFTLLSAAMTGIQNFLPSTLLSLHGTPLGTAAAAVTAFLIGSSVGTIVGAMTTHHRIRPDIIVGAGLAAAAAFVLLIGGVDLGTIVLVGVLAVTGFAMGITTPSRDLMVRAIAPAGGTGRVFGFVYAGLDIGGAVAPLIVGLLLDHGKPRGVLLMTAGLLLLGILAVVAMQWRRPARRLQPAE